MLEWRRPGALILDNQIVLYVLNGRLIKASQQLLGNKVILRRDLTLAPTAPDQSLDPAALSFSIRKVELTAL